MNTLLLVPAILATFAIANMNIPVLYAQPSSSSNMTDLPSALKSQLPTGSLQKAAEPGDIIVTLICPSDVQNILTDCQWFIGQPYQPPTPPQ